jgi:hypothetical protein
MARTVITVDVSNLRTSARPFILGRIQGPRPESSFWATRIHTGHRAVAAPRMEEEEAAEAAAAAAPGEVEMYAKHDSQ